MYCFNLKIVSIDISFYSIFCFNLFLIQLLLKLCFYPSFDILILFYPHFVSIAILLSSYSYLHVLFVGNIIMFQFTDMCTMCSIITAFVGVLRLRLVRIIRIWLKMMLLGRNRGHSCWRLFLAFALKWSSHRGQRSSLGDR